MHKLLTSEVLEGFGVSKVLCGQWFECCGYYFWEYIFCQHNTKHTENWLFFGYVGQIYFGNINQGVNLKVRSSFSLVSITGRPRLPISFWGSISCLVKYICQDSAQFVALQACLIHEDLDLK